MIGRAITLLAALIATITSTGAAILWLGHHAPAVLVVVPSLLLVLLLSIAVSGSLNDIWRESGLGVFLICPTAAAVLATLLPTTPRACVYSVSIGILGTTLLYMWDRQNHKSCPECAERVLARARICRYCGYQFWPKTPGTSV